MPQACGARPWTQGGAARGGARNTGQFGDESTPDGTRPDEIHRLADTMPVTRQHAMQLMRLVGAPLLLAAVALLAMF